MNKLSVPKSKPAFPKKIWGWLVIVSVLGLLFQSYLQPGMPYTHDGENHLARFANYKQALKEQQLPPRFAPRLLNGYGYPVFNYNYPLPNILSLPLSVLKMPLSLTFKLLMVFSVTTGLYGVWQWLKQLQLSSLNQLLGMGLFGLSPYLFSAIVYRGSIGEVMAVCLIPWLFYGVEQARRHQLTLGSWSGMGTLLLAAAFLLSHNVTVLFGLPLVVLYAVFRLGRNKPAWVQMVTSYVWAGALSLWFWLPAISEKSQVVLDRAGLSQEYRLHFPTFSELLASPLQFGFSYPGSIDTLSFSLGLAQWLTLVIATLVVIHQLWLQRSIKGSQLMVGTVVVGWLLVWLQLSASASWWELVPLVRFIQFPWRLGVLVMAWVPLMWAVTASYWSRVMKRILIGLLIFQALLISRAAVTSFVDRPNIEYELFGQSTTTKNENLPLTFKYLLIGDWQPRPSNSQGQVEFKVLHWTGTEHRYQAKVEAEALVIEPTMYFLGWQTTIASLGEKTTVTYEDSDQIAGRIAFRLQPGEYQITTRFTQQTWPRLIGNTVSLVAGVGLVLISIKKRYRSDSQSQAA